MQETINKLREQPEEHRRAIAATIAVAIAGILLVGWFLLFMHDLNKSNLEYTRPAQTFEEEQTNPAASFDTSASATGSTSATDMSAPSSGLNGY